MVSCLQQGVQMICIWSSWCHCQPIISCPSKIETGLIFLVPSYPGCPGKATGCLVFLDKPGLTGPSQVLLLHSTCPRREHLGISGTDVLPVPNKALRKHTALTQTSGLVSFSLHQSPDSRDGSSSPMAGDLCNCTINTPWTFHSTESILMDFFILCKMRTTLDRSPCCIDIETIYVKSHHGQQILNKSQLECEAKASSDTCIGQHSSCYWFHCIQISWKN